MAAIEHLTISISPSEFQSKYSKLEDIHNGVKTTIYRATDRSSAETVIVKIIDLQGARGVWHDQRHLQSVIREIEITGKVQYLIAEEGGFVPHYTELKGVYLVKGGAEETVRLVMGDAQPGGIGGIIRKAKTGLAPGHVANIMRQALTALKYLHASSIVHRDIKGDNLVLDRGGLVRLIDFGTSREIPEGQRPGTNTGTTGYKSPQVSEGAYTTKTDIWSLGATAKELVEGRQPEEPQEQYGLVTRVERQIVFADEGTLPAAMVDFVRCCGAEREEERWSAEQLLEHPFLQLACSDQELYDHLTSPIN